MLWVLGVIALGGLLLLLVLAMVSTPTLDPRDYGDHLNPELTGNAGVSELVELAARVRKETRVMNNRLGKVLFWVLNMFVLLFLAAAMSLPAMAAPVAADNTMGMVLMVTSVVLFCGFSVWPTRFIWALTLVIRIPVLVLILLAAGLGKVLMQIDHVVALIGRRVLEVGNDR